MKNFKESLDWLISQIPDNTDNDPVFIISGKYYKYAEKLNWEYKGFELVKNLSNN